MASRKLCGMYNRSFRLRRRTARIPGTNTAPRSNGIAPVPITMVMDGTDIGVFAVRVRAGNVPAIAGRISGSCVWCQRRHSNSSVSLTATVKQIHMHCSGRRPAIGIRRLIRHLTMLQ